MNILLQYRRTIFLWLVSAIFMSGCASNDELFAEYEHQCRVGIIANATGVAIFEEVTGKTMQWEQAVYFKFDIHDLTQDEEKRLDTNIAVLNEFPEMKVYIRGFTDSIASPWYNEALSQKRVDTVRKYLNEKGINNDRLLTSAAGESLPLANNKTYASRAVNRRVELSLLDQYGRPAPFIMDATRVEQWVEPANISEPGLEDPKDD